MLVFVYDDNDNAIRVENVTNDSLVDGPDNVSCVKIQTDCSSRESISASTQQST